MREHRLDNYTCSPDRVYDAGVLTVLLLEGVMNPGLFPACCWGAFSILIHSTWSHLLSKTYRSINKRMFFCFT